MTSIPIAFALALLLPVSTLRAVPTAGNQPVPRDLRPNGGQACKPDLAQAWCGEAVPSGADAAPKDLPGEWATPAVHNNPDAVAELRAVSADANPPPKLDQAMLERVRVRLRNLGLLWLLDLAEAGCGEAVPSGADAAHDCATPAVQSNAAPLAGQPEKVSPDAVAAPLAVWTDANPPPELDQTMLEGLRVRLRSRGLLWLLDLAQAWCGDAGPSDADAAHKGLPGDWASPTVQRNYWPLVRQSREVSPDAVAEPRAVSTDANPSPQLDQALLEGVRVRLRNLGFLGLTEVSDSAQAEAISRFQASINIPETGVLNRDTLGRLLVP